MLKVYIILIDDDKIGCVEFDFFKIILYSVMMGF